ncbi:winged helix-turn-helix domain-containing protein [Maricaulis sp.]|uniref:winged helix-turn-helix domain-containing protein n=1 Tax=Maricaulis sp. TaxID=1486257 RepID=UPI003A8DBE89
MMMNISSPVSTRRSPSDSIIQIGDAVCDLRNCVLEVGGRSHRLEPRLAGVLDLLVRRGGAPVTRDEFLDSVWDEDGSDEALNQAISRLRRLLGRADLIQTLPRVGYRLAIDPAPAALAGLPARDRPGVTFGDLVDGIDRGSFIAGFIVAALLAGVLYAMFGMRVIEREFEVLNTDLVPAIQSGDLSTPGD